MKVTIEVQDTSHGFEIRVENVTILKDHNTNKTDYYIDGVHFEEKPDIDDRKTRDFFQVAYLVYRQKEAKYRQEIEDIIDEILKM